MCAGVIPFSAYDGTVYFLFHKLHKKHHGVVIFVTSE